MADYYPLIAKAVASAAPSTPDGRQAIYERARAALSRQLASIDPPPAAEIVDREIGALEAVIRRIEAEHAGFHAEAPAETVRPDSTISEPGTRQSAGARPQAPVRERSGTNRKPLYAAIGALGLVAVAAIATLAFLRRNEPPAMATPRPAPAPASTPAQRPASAAKTDDRVTPGDRVTGTSEPAQRPQAQAQPPTQQQPPTAPSASPPVASAPQSPQAPPAIAVANKLTMAMQGVDRPENVVVRQGVVVWRTEMVSGAQGQPPSLAIKALLDVPDARMRGEMTILRNRDPAFPASHTIQVQFTPAAGSEFGAVRNLDQIEMRQTDSQPGYPLAGQGIAVMENLFLLALAQIEPAQARNVDMMRSRPIVYIEFQGAAARRGAMILEKGVSGQQAFDEAFRNWQ